MRTRALVIMGLWFAVVAGPASARTPVVVELFTSQGCAACVKTGDLMGDLAGRPHVLALTFDVDYWDYLGWEDTFAKPEFADRQRAYLKPLGVRDVYTPQVVVDGRLQAAAVDPQTVAKLVKAEDHATRAPPAIMATKARIAVGSAKPPKGGGEVWLVRYDPHDQTVVVKNGENRGRTIVEHNVVREPGPAGRLARPAEILSSARSHGRRSGQRGDRARRPRRPHPGGAEAVGPDRLSASVLVAVDLGRPDNRDPAFGQSYLGRRLAGEGQPPAGAAVGRLDLK